MRSLLLAIAFSCLALTSAAGAERVWTGGGGAGSPQWTLPINWGGTAPDNGDTLVFPNVTNKSGINDIAPGTTFGPLTITANGYALSGNLVALTGGIFLDGANNATIAFPISLTAPVNLTVGNAGGTLTLGQTLSGAGGITKSGPGMLVLNGNNSYSGPTIVYGGALQVGDTIAGPVTMNAGYLTGTGTVQGITALNQGAVSISPGTSSATGTLTSNGNVKLYGSDFLRFDLSSTSDKLAVTGTGTVDLGAATLAFTVINHLPLNTDVTLVDNDGSDLLTYDATTPSNYLFSLTLSGEPYVVSMIGGSNRNDVVIRRVPSSAFTSMSLSASTTSPGFGDSVTFTANITGAMPGAPLNSQPVLFFDGNEYLDTGSFTTATQATLTTNALKPGLRKITAYYLGDNTKAPYRSTICTVNVGGTATTTTLTVTPSGSSAPNQNVNLSASVTGSGSVIFYDGTAALSGPILVSGGPAIINTTTLFSGVHTLSARFTPTGGFLPSSANVAHSVTGAATTTTLASNANPVVAGTALTLTATVNTAVTGSVVFKDGAATLATVAISGTSASFITSGLPTGTRSLTASFTGSTNHDASTGTLAQVVNGSTSGGGGGSGGPVELEESSGCGLGGGVATLVLGLLLLVGLRLRRD